MSKGAPARTHAVIDGSNLATEGRKEPSLTQLDEAVRTIAEQYRFSQITVIVDATFEHRVAKAETKAARAAIDDNDLLTPPAGVIGRGDAFILQVADRANAVVFSNDSFQEFHGVYDWLFEEGRLIGGKPVPGVGWIYVARSPVRGPVSRRATAEGRRTEKKTRIATETAAKAEPATGATPRARAAAKRPAREAQPAAATPTRRSGRTSRASAPAPSAATSEGSNDPALWRTFKADFPVGSTIAVQVDRFSSHGAYGSVDEVIVYLPNRLLADPPPTKARDVIELGATVDFVIHRYDDERHGVDAGLIPVPGASRSAPRPAARAAAKSAPTAAAPAAAKKTTAKKAPAKKTATRIATAAAAKKSTARKPSTTTTTAKKTAVKAAAKKTAAKKTAAKAPATTTRGASTRATKATAKKATKRR